MDHTTSCSSPSCSAWPHADRAHVRPQDVLAERWWAGLCPVSGSREDSRLRKARKRGAVAQNRRVTARINEYGSATSQVRLLAEEMEVRVGIMRSEEARRVRVRTGSRSRRGRGRTRTRPSAGRSTLMAKRRCVGEERKLRAAPAEPGASSRFRKMVQLRPKIGSHDYAWKRDRALEFLRDGSKVEGGRAVPWPRARAYPGARPLPDRAARGGRQGGRPAFSRMLSSLKAGR